MKRRHVLKGALSLAAASAVPGRLAANCIVEPDAELMELGRELQAAIDAAMPALLRVDSLRDEMADAQSAWLDAEEARRHALFGQIGPQLDEGALYREYCALCERQGYSAAVDAENDVLEAIDKITARIRHAPEAVTPAGFLVKLKALAHDMEAADHSKDFRTGNPDAPYGACCLREVLQQMQAATGR